MRGDKLVDETNGDELGDEMSDAMRAAAEKGEEEQENEDRAAHLETARQRTLRIYNAALSVKIYFTALQNAGFSEMKAFNLASMTQLFFLEEQGL